MKLFIIRHAQSANNVIETDDYARYMSNRVVDPTITELGFQQTDRLAHHLAGQVHAEHVHEAGHGVESGYGITHLYCSPMLRTLQTTWPVSQALGIQPEVWVDIFEQGGMFLGDPRTGDGLTAYPGMNRAEIAAQYPGYKIPANITQNGWWTGVYEDHHECEARAASVALQLREMAAQMPEARVAIITHGTFSDRLCKALIGHNPESSAIYFNFYNTAITRLDFWAGGLALRYTNRVQHLPPNLVSF